MWVLIVIIGLGLVAVLALAASHEAHGWLYSWRHARHVLELAQAGPEGAPEFYGSLDLAAEQALHHEYPPAWLAAPPDDGRLDWWERTMAELSPEALDGFEITEHFPEPPGGWDSLRLAGDENLDGEGMDVQASSSLLAAPVQPEPGPGDALSSLASSGPDQISPWLERQLDILHSWSEWQQDKMRICA